jgi:hypothetical protein
VREIVAAFELVNLARACAYPLESVAGALVNSRSSSISTGSARAIERLPAGNRWQAGHALSLPPS